MGRYRKADQVLQVQNPGEGALARNGVGGSAGAMPYAHASAARNGGGGGREGVGQPYSSNDSEPF